MPNSIVIVAFLLEDVGWYVTQQCAISVVGILRWALRLFGIFVFGLTNLLDISLSFFFWACL
jgi:hypothetical protein